MAQILYGDAVAESLSERVRSEVGRLGSSGIVATLAIVRVGEEPDQLSYERGATRRCDALGLGVVHEVLPAGAGQDELLAVLERLNADVRVHGILLLSPLPAGFDYDLVRNAIAREKDVDGISDASLAGVFTDDGVSFAPCTAQACIETLDHYGIEVAGRNAVVLGRSLVVGRPLSMLLLHRDATVTVCHSRTADLLAQTARADILAVAIGRERLVGAEHVACGQTVLDVGINWNAEQQRLFGDVDFDAVERLVGALTPVPAGIGAVTTCVLAAHVVEAACRAQGAAARTEEEL